MRDSDAKLANNYGMVQEDLWTGNTSEPERQARGSVIAPRLALGLGPSVTLV